MANSDTNSRGSIDPRLSAAEVLIEQANIPAACNEYLLYAGKCLADGQLLEAIEYYRKIGEYGLLNVEGRLQLAGLYIATDNETEAIEVYDNLADDYIAQGLPDEALDIYRKAIENIPGRDTLHFKLAELFASSGNTSKALNIYLDILKENPENTGILESIADIYIKRNSKSEAIDAYLKIAAIYENEGNLENLARCYGAILELSPRNFAALKTLAEVYVKLGDKERLVMTLTRLAKSFYEKGEKENALNLYNKILQLDPKNVYAQERLGESIKVISILPDDSSGEYTEISLESSVEIPAIDVGEIKGEPMDPDIDIKTARDLIGVDLPIREDSVIPNRITRRFTTTWELHTSKWDCTMKRLDICSSAAEIPISG